MRSFLTLFFLLQYIALIFISQCYANVLTTLKPIAFIAAAMTEGVTDTEVLLKDGASPHNYALKPSDVQRIKSADVIVWVGEDLEFFLTKTLNQINANKILTLSNIPEIKKIIAETEEGDHHHDGQQHGRQDMHIWMSPSIAKIIAENIHKKLVELLPESRVQLDANLVLFQDSLKKTENRVTEKLSKVANQGYFVFHDAYGYFEREFKLKHLGHFMINPVIEPGAKKLYQIRSELKNKNAVCIFSEPQFNPTTIIKIAKDTQVKISNLDPLGIDVDITQNSYVNFLSNLAQQFENCLVQN